MQGIVQAQAGGGSHWRADALLSVLTVFTPHFWDCVGKGGEGVLTSFSLVIAWGAFEDIFLLVGYLVL